jgi:hypothetical protein
MSPPSSDVYCTVGGGSVSLPMTSGVTVLPDEITRTFLGEPISVR